MSLITRIWQRIRRPISFRGVDLEGNSFHEYPSTTEDPRRTKRIVIYRQRKQMWEYASSSYYLPMQWKSWLTHTRPDPPTLEELRADVYRQQRLAQNVARIGIRDREERLRMAQASEQQKLVPPADLRAVHSESSTGQETASTADVQPAPDVGRSSSLSPPNVPPTRRTLPLQGNQDYADETQSWTPRTIRRGS